MNAIVNTWPVHYQRKCVDCSWSWNPVVDSIADIRTIHIGTIVVQDGRTYKRGYPLFPHIVCKLVEGNRSREFLRHPKALQGKKNIFIDRQSKNFDVGLRYNIDFVVVSPET